MKSRDDMITVFVVRPGASGAGSHEFLQLQRSGGDYLGNTWQIIRGGVEPGETYVQAALREMREECGLSPLELYRCPSVESFYTSIDDTLWHSVAFCALVARDAPIRLNHEHDDYRWVPEQQLEPLVMWASERQVLADLCRDILRNSPARPHLRIELT